MPTPPLISIVIVTWNSAKHLPRCLDCLALQTIQDFEVILVDNGSLDGGSNDLEQKYTQLALHIERLPSNLGFALANNRGAGLARGKWLALLNADAYPEPNWLENLLRAAQRHPEFSFFPPAKFKKISLSFWMGQAMNTMLVVWPGGDSIIIRLGNMASRRKKSSVPAELPRFTRGMNS